MSVTVTEACNINALLRWLLDINRYGEEQLPTSDEARAAAILLVDAASKRLGAGLHGPDVTTAKWAELAKLVEGSRTQKGARRVPRR